MADAGAPATAEPEDARLVRMFPVSALVAPADRPKPMSTKQCATCQLVKPVADFGVNRSRRDGRHNECRPCVRDRQARTPSVRLNTKVYNEAVRRLIAAHPDDYQALRESVREELAIRKAVQAGMNLDRPLPEIGPDR